MKPSLSTPNISLTMNSVSDWEKSLLPFIKGSGIFIATDGYYYLNQTVNFKLNLNNGAEIFALVGQVVFINPALAQANFGQGIGLEITTPDWQMLKSKISALVNKMDKET